VYFTEMSGFRPKLPLEIPEYFADLVAKAATPEQNGGCGTQKLCK
jgi:hypothetical protein